MVVCVCVCVCAWCVCVCVVCVCVCVLRRGGGKQLKRAGALFSSAPVPVSVCLYLARVWVTVTCNGGRGGKVLQPWQNSSTQAHTRDGKLTQERTFDNAVCSLCYELVSGAVAWFRLARSECLLLQLKHRHQNSRGGQHKRFSCASKTTKLGCNSEKQTQRHATGTRGRER